VSAVLSIRHVTLPGATGTLQRASEPMEVLAIDFLSLEREKGGYENILVVTDTLTKFVWAFPTTNSDA